MIRNTLKPLNHYHLIVWLLAISAPIFLILEITRITFPSTKPTGCRKAIEAIADAVYFPTPKGTVIPILQLFIYHLSYIFVTKTLYQLILSDYFPLDVFFRQLSCYHMIEFVIRFLPPQRSKSYESRAICEGKTYLSFAILLRSKNKETEGDHR